MKNLLRVLLPFLPLLATACAAGEVATAEDVEDDQGTSESEVVGCTLAPGCATYTLLSARSYLGRRVPNVTRTDVRATIAGAPSQVAPRTITKKTSGVMRFGEGRLTLSGDRDCTAPVVIDDFLLIEILGLDGARLGMGLVSHQGITVLVEGRALDSLTPAAPWSGSGSGYRYPSGAIDITSIVPRNAPFRIRVSAFDLSDEAFVSDVHMRFVPAGAVPKDDPWDANSCTGTPLGVAEVAGRLGSKSSVDLGKITVLARSRECSGASCADWQADPQFSFVRLAGRPSLPYQWGTPLAGTARLGTSEINPNLALQITSDDGVTSDGSNNVDALRIECFSGLGSARASCRSWAQYWRNGAIGPDMAPTVLVGDERAAFSGIVTDHCVRLEAAGSFAKASSRRENQVVVFGKY